MECVWPFNKLKEKLGFPEPGCKIPIKKTEYIPMLLMNINQSTVEGNAEVISQLLQQMGLTKQSNKEGAPGSHFKKHVMSVMESCKIEKTEKNHLQFVVFILGLFHL